MSTTQEALAATLAEREKHLPFTLEEVDAEAWLGGQKERVRATVDALTNALDGVARLTTRLDKCAADLSAALQKSHENANKAMQALDRAETAEARVAELEGEWTEAMALAKKAIQRAEKAERERDGLQEALTYSLPVHSKACWDTLNHLATNCVCPAARMNAALAAIPAPDAAPRDEPNGLLANTLTLPQVLECYPDAMQSVLMAVAERVREEAFTATAYCSGVCWTNIKAIDVAALVKRSGP